MSKEEKVTLVGGPWQGEHEHWDTDNVYEILRSAGGEEFVYKRDERPNGVFYVYDEATTSVLHQSKGLSPIISPNARSAFSQTKVDGDDSLRVDGEGNVKLRVHVVKNADKKRWELTVENKILETCPLKDINSAEDAANWMRQLGIGE